MSFKFLCSLLAFCCFFLTEGSADDWGYAGERGVKYWCQIDKQCCGENQSPIDLSVDPPFGGVDAIFFQEYDKVPTSMTAQNNGRYVTVSVNGASPTIYHQGLSEFYSYNFHSFRLHWGGSSSGSPGSEHTIKGKRYPMELQIVHYSEEFSDLESAVASGRYNAVVILGILFELREESNPTIDNFIKQLNATTYSGQSVTIDQPFPLQKLLPQNVAQFFQYDGSLTEPGCNEVVVWIVFRDRAWVTSAQLDVLRSLMTNAKGETDIPMVDNFRPIQPLNGRYVGILSGD